MRRKLTMLLILSVITFLLCFFPYKHYISISFGPPIPASSTIAEEMLGLSGVYWKACLPYLVIFLPIIVSAEILFANGVSLKKGRIIFSLQGIVGLLATYEMYRDMTFNFFERDIKLTPIFYLSLIWVCSFSLACILIGVPGINNYLTKKWNS